MYTNEEIDIRLWDYIDGSSNDAEMAAVRALIATDVLWQQRYEQLLHIHGELQQCMEPEQPSMRFTKNVMENIQSSAIARPARSYVSKWVVGAIGGFFVIMLIAVLVAAVGTTAHAPDTTGNHTIVPAFVRNLSLGQVFNNTTLIFSIAACTIAALLFFDTWRSRRLHMNGKQ